MISVLHRAIVALVVLIAWMLPAQAQQLAENVGPLKVELGDNGTWKAESKSGWLLLSNRTDPNSIRLFYVSRPPLTAGTRTVRANVLVRGEGDADSYAGLLFARQDAGNFMGFLIRNDGAVVWMNQTPDDTIFRPAEGVQARMDGTDILELRETSGRIELVLNGKTAMTAENQDGFAPTVGIVTVGTGRFGFDAFDVQDAMAGPEPRDERRDEPRNEPRNDNTALTPEQINRMQILLGTTLGVLFHELGHALIGETNLPATGPEEDVADGFSAFVMSAIVNETEDPVVAEYLAGMVRYTGLLWYYSAKAKERVGDTPSWQDEHAPDIRRFRNVFCIIYGSNPQRYEEIATRFELELPTRQRCLQEFKKRYAAWETLMRTVTRKSPDDPAARHPADAPGGKINLQIQAPTGPLATEVHNLINGPDAMLRQVMAFLEQAIVWPRDLKVEFKHCPGMRPNAWYDPNNGSVTMCYEVIDFFSTFIFEGEKADGPLRRTNAPEVDPTRYLQGTWETQIQGANNMVVTISYSFAGDGSFRSVVQAGQQTITTEGTWKAGPGADGLIRLDLNPTRSEPAQICDPNGNCQPNRPGPETILLKVRDNATFHSSGLDFTRAR